MFRQRAHDLGFAAIGVAPVEAAVAFVRGFVRGRTIELGNFWVDLVRGALRILRNIGLAVVTVLQAGQDLLRRGTQCNAQVVDQRQRAIGPHLGVERQLGIGRAAPHQRAAGSPPHIASRDAS